VLEVPDLARVRTRIVFALLVREPGDQASITRIEVEMALVGPAEVGLLEQELHAQQALPEIDCTLARRADERDVMNPLHLDASHWLSWTLGPPARARSAWRVGLLSRIGRDKRNRALIV
jgi:hypothetical protein